MSSVLPSDDEKDVLATVAVEAETRIILPSLDNFGIYLRDIRRYRHLIPGEEIELSRRVQRNDVQAMHRMVVANLGLVVSIAKAYQGCGLELPDLVGEGNCGLIQAVPKFDARRGFRFSTHATRWIRKEILHALNWQSRAVRLTATGAGLVNAVRRVQRELTQKHFRDATTSEIARRLDVPIAAVEEGLALAQGMLSFDHTSDGADGIQHSLAVDCGSHSPLGLVVEAKRRGDIDRVLATLTPREARVIGLRFSLDDGPWRSLDDVGKILGITRERVRQLEARALKKLRHVTRARRLRPHYDELDGDDRWPVPVPQLAVSGS